MIRPFVRFAVAFFLLTTLAPVAWGAAPEGISWHRNLAQAYRLAQADSKPLVIYFCGEGLDISYSLCRKLESGPLASREMAAFRDRAVFVRVDVALDDIHGNVNQFMETLNVTALPTVAVVECGVQEWNLAGQLNGYFETKEFVDYLRTIIIRATIEIRRAKQPPLTEAELYTQMVQRMQRVRDANDALEEVALKYAKHKARLLEQGELDYMSFVTIAQAHRQAYDYQLDVLYDFAALPTQESREMGQVILDLGIREYDLCQHMEQDLDDLSFGTMLVWSNVAKAQLVVRATDDSIQTQAQQASVASTAATEKMSQWMREHASTVR